MKITFFANIPIEPDRQMILRRMGYKKNVHLDNEVKYFLEESIQEGISLCRLSGVMRRVSLSEWNEESVRLETGDVFKSVGLSRILERSDEVLLMAATAGRDIADRVYFEMNEGDVSKGIVMDSAASVAVDSAIAWIKDFADDLLKREGKRVTKHRYSPGFRDFSLSDQKTFYKVLELDSIGISLTDKFMMVPEKSITAIVGVENINAV